MELRFTILLFFENFPGLKDRKTVMELDFEFGKTII
jgi:hypothetical protein